MGLLDRKDTAQRTIMEATGAPRGEDRPTGSGNPATALLRRRWVGLVMAAGSVLVAMAASASAAPVPVAEHLAATAVFQVDTEGGVAYARQCAGCHGPEAQGSVGPDLRSWAGSVAETEAIVRSGADGMPSFAATLSAGQIEALARHVDDLVGVSVYAQECAGCHGPSGEGSSGPSLKLTAMDDDSLRSVIESGVGSMPGFSDELTERQIEALVRRSAGYRAFGPSLYAAECGPCHGSDGQGATGPPLTSSAVTQSEAVTIVRSGFGGMPAFEATLEPGDIEAVVAFALRLDSPPPTTTTTTTLQPASAVDLYADLCAACHGADAEGGVAPPLVGLGLSNDEIADAIVVGVGSMPAFASALTDEEVEALVDFLQVLSGPGDGDDDALVPAFSFFALGADLYAEQCAACHGADGRGGVARSLRTTQLTGPALIESIAKGNATMPAFERSLSPGQIARAAEFVEWLKQAGDVGLELRTGPVIYRQDCAACHGDRGEGGLGPVLARTPLTVNEIIAQIYGGHSAGMPAFAGALDGSQVLEVAQFTKTLEGKDEQNAGIGTLGLALIVVGTAAGIAAVGAFGYRSLRRRQKAA